ncbi:MAG: ABC transporter ATP-binding protein [Actinobacteria bacterium]|nr:ABC transporter ATP-binding protein [Actinomycetota bacterium]
MIKVENLKKTYAGKNPTVALRGVSFEVLSGEFVAVMGRSGSGKSTLLHQLSLIDTPTEGKIVIGGVEVLRLADAKKTAFRLRHIGYVFQEYTLVAELNALENVYLPAFALGADHNGYKKRASEMLELVGLSHRLDHYPHELSGGELQRVAVARALINRPKIILADEPTANLDSVSAKEVLELFQKLNQELEQTIVMVTHEPEDTKYVDWAIWLKDGVIEQIERPLIGLGG